ncbi:hypothetical protein ATY78_20540 [Rhizobium sp. R635]|uniref:gas vesicle accessory protein GvpU n=1 Tax=Rhizobium sp. R635 TaxID=1764275 RepID=UPI000B52AF80|nr:gas vesicle accessory protein GvpU [Rhizobium sp. R635]OWV88890.1 hypothetical protein ATY78_20540 [Rhizobium sp. R635]
MMEQENRSSSSSDEAIVPHPDGDWLLEGLVDFANNTSFRIGIILNVKGIMVSGVLIGGKQYFELFADRFASGFADKDTADHLREHYRSLGEIYDEPQANVSRPSFIHLVDAQVYDPSGSKLPSENGELWRGRVSSVDGFFLGLFQRK